MTRVELASNSPISVVSQLNATDNVANPRQDGVLKLDQIAIGKALEATVFSMSKDGTALLKLQTGTGDGSMVQAKLPSGFQIGDQLQLTLLSRDGNAPSFSIGLLPGKDSVSLSGVGQLLNELLQKTHGQTIPRLESKQALLASPPVDSKQLTQQLQHSLKQSGLFYESHLREWVNGERSIDQIRQEPQNKVIDNNQDPNHWIPLQIDSLENKHVLWQGELFPGQTMEWDVTQEDKHQSSNQQGDDLAWQTVVRFNLPNLGKITAKIRLQGEHIQLNLHTQREETADQLKSHRHRLDESLFASGNQLDQFVAQQSNE